MPINTAKVIVGHASIFTAPENTVAPLDGVDVGTDWSAPWKNVGATEEGVSFAVGTDTNDIRVEEQVQPVAILVTSRNVRAMFALSEDTLESMKLAYGGGVIATQAPGPAGIVGKSTLSLSDSFERLALGFEGLNSFGFFRRVYIPSVLSVADVTTPYRRAANNRSYAVELRAVCKSSDIKIVDKTAAATS